MSWYSLTLKQLIRRCDKLFCLLQGSALIVSIALQFYLKRYVVPVYWSSVVLISVVGTLLTDNLTDNAGVQLWISSVAFAAALACVFALWWAVERTLSVHSIFTTRREVFYWLTILFTFALGTHLTHVPAASDALATVAHGGLRACRSAGQSSQYCLLTLVWRCRHSSGRPRR
jgi:uncharacterized membrane-anchored protein